MVSVVSSRIRHSLDLAAYRPLEPNIPRVRPLVGDFIAPEAGSKQGWDGPRDRAAQNEGSAEDFYRSLIGAAVFSAGAGGSAGVAPSFCASALGCAGSGEIP